MKTLGLLILSFTIVNCYNIHTNVARFAIKDLLSEHFEKGSQKLDVVFYGNYSKAPNNLIESILHNGNLLVSISVSKTEQNNPWKNQLNISSILIFDSAKTFLERKHKIKWLSNKRMRFEHLVYFPNASVNDFEDIQDGFAIDNVNFLVNETENSIDLLTGYMFSEYKCHQNQFVTINKFDSKTMRWENSNFYPEKYHNLHGCNLTLTLEDFNQREGET